MKWIVLILIALFILLQYKLWLAKDGVDQTWLLHQKLDQLEQKNNEKQQRNQALAAEIKDLKQGYVAVEERARSELGMIKKGEVFYQIIP